MSRILVLGGYGGFGARIARRLASAGHEVLVAGRSLAKAEAFCAGAAGLVPLALDRAGDLATALAQHRPFALVDAAGPFQGADDAVIRACLAAGCHYLDIADGRDFVAGIARHDGEARAAGCVVLSGASSVPALSGAVIRELLPAFAQVRAVEIAISASNRATAGLSVARAILSYVGKPVRLWRGGRWDTGYGWQEVRRERFEVADAPSLRGRRVQLADVPDLALLPARLPGRPAVAFRAGTELAIGNLALRILSWPVRWGWLSSLAPLATWLLRGQALLSGFGSSRSGMIVRLFGLDPAGLRLERCWTLVASDGDGPEIPALAVPILIEALAAGRLRPGARDASEALALADFAPAFASLAIRHAVSDHPQALPLYRRVMGEAFERLPAPVRAMHDVLRDDGARGHAAVVRGRSPFARLVAALFGFPPEGQFDLHVHFEERDGVETWTRDFAGRRFRSRMRQRGRLLVERFGALSFGFALPSDRSGLTMELRRWWLGPLPLPLALAPRIEAREWEADGRFQLDVAIGLPLVGPIVRYRGSLDPARGAESASGPD